MILITIGLIVTVCILGIQVSKLSDENSKLRNQILRLKAEIKNAVPNNATTTSTATIQKPAATTVQRSYTNTNATNVTRTVAKKDKSEVKNTLILFSGALLIVLAAIVFLMSMWGKITDVTKISILVLLIGVFAGASRVAENTFKLKKVANTFFYMAMAYIPILTLAIYLINLYSGSFITNVLKYGFWAIASVIISVIYYFASKIKNKKLLFIGSLIMQVVAVIFTTLIYKNDNIFIEIVQNISIYNLVLYFINKISIKNMIISPFSKLLYYISLFGTFISLMIGVISGMIASIAVTIFVQLIYAILISIDDNDVIFKYIYKSLLLLLVVTIINLSFMSGVTYLVKQIIMVTAILLLFVFSLFSADEKDRMSSYILTYIGLFGILLATSISNLFTIITEQSIIKSYIIFAIASAVSAVMYIRELKKRNIFLHCGIILYVLAGIGLILSYEYINNALLILIPAPLLILSILTDENIIITLHANIFANVFAISGLLTGSGILLPLSCMAVLFLYVGKHILLREKPIDVFGLAYINYLLIALGIYFKIDNYFPYALFVSAILAFAISKFDKKVATEECKWYVFVIQIISMIALSYKVTLLKYILNIITLVLFSSTFDKYLNLIPMGIVILNTYTSELITLGGDDMTWIASMLLILCNTILSLKEEKINVYAFIPYICLLLQYLKFEINDYINIAILTIISALQVINYKDSMKLIAKALLYFSGLIFYNKVINDLGIEQTTLKILGYTIFAILISRKVLFAYNKEFAKVFEYVSLSILFIIGIFNYIDITDAMMLLAMLLLAIVYSYFKKYGPAFLCATIAEIFAALHLTKEFWLNIPWWIYLLVIGSCLIIFAIRNELNENKNSLKIKDTFQTIKEKFDL